MGLPLLTHLRRAEVFAVLAHRDFRYIFLAEVFGGAGNTVYWVALPWLVLQEIGTATAVGITSAASGLPVLVLAPVAGVLADRLNRKTLMLISHVVRMFLLALLIVAGRSMSLDTAHFAIAGFLLTAAGLLLYPARVAILPNLLPKEDLVAGNAALAAGMQAIRIGGTAAAGFLFAAIGGLNVLGGALVAYGVAAVLIGRIQAPAQTIAQSAVTTGAKPFARLKALLRNTKSDLLLSAAYILKHPLIRAVAVAGVVLNAFHYPAMGALLPAYFSQALDAGPESFGLFGAIESAAILIALPAAPWLARRLGDGKLSAAALAVMGILVAVLAIADQLWHVFAVAVLMGFLTAGVLPMQSLVQAETPDHIRGKVVANLAVLNIAFVPLTALLGGYLIDATGARPLYLVTGMVVLLAGAGLLLVKEVRQAQLGRNGGQPDEDGAQ